MHRRFKTKGFVIIHAEFGEMGIGNAAAGQYLLHIVLADEQRLGDLALLVQLNALRQLFMHGLHHIHAALLCQRITQNGLKGLLLGIGGLGNGCMEDGVHKGFLALLDAASVIEGLVDVSCPPIKGREQKSDGRTADCIGDATVVEDLFFRNIVERCFCELHGTHSAEQKFEGFVGFLAVAVLFEGNIVCIAADQDQIALIQRNRFHDLTVKAHAQFLISQVGLAKCHQKLVFRTVHDLRSLEVDVDQMLSDGAGQTFAEQAKVFVPLVFRHHTCTAAKFGDDLLAAIDIAAVNGCHITAVPADMPADLSNLFDIHNLPHLVKSGALLRILFNPKDISSFE